MTHCNNCGTNQNVEKHCEVAGCTGDRPNPAPLCIACYQDTIGVCWDCELNGARPGTAT